LSSTIEESDRFLSLVLANRWNAAILERISQLKLADWWLTAGCLAQSVWNGIYKRAPDQGILDYDVFYFDPERDASDAIDRFPCGSVAIGVRRVGDGFKIHAPFGLSPVLHGELIPNPALQIPEVYAAKAERWCRVWPDLKVREWPVSDAQGKLGSAG
jgi:hypothetical protein